MKDKRRFLIAALLIATLACIAPGLAAPTVAPPAAPTPTADTRLPTLVAEKVLAAMTETAQALPPTPTFTSTPEPPTSTPTPTATRTVQSLLVLQADSSTLFMDERAGYGIVIPAGWLMGRVGQPEFLDALTAAEALHPLVHGAFLNAQNESPDFLRLFAVDTQDDVVAGEPVTTIKLILD